MFVAGLPTDFDESEKVLDEFEKMGEFKIEGKKDKTYAFLYCKSQEIADTIVQKMHRQVRFGSTLNLSYGTNVKKITLENFKVTAVKKVIPRQQELPQTNEPKPADSQQDQVLNVAQRVPTAQEQFLQQQRALFAQQAAQQFMHQQQQQFVHQQQQPPAPLYLYAQQQQQYQQQAPWWSNSFTPVIELFVCINTFKCSDLGSHSDWKCNGFRLLICYGDAILCS